MTRKTWLERPQIYLDIWLQYIELFSDQAVNIKLDHLTLEQLIPATGGFYRYLGSLTTPPCAEAVKWTVFDKSQYITERQLEAFRSLDLANGLGADIEKNFRPLQDLNGRVIQHYTK